MSDRDTHFQGFAKLLYDELSKLEGSHETLISEYRNKYDKQAIVNLMAKRAYDLVFHTIMNIDPYHLDVLPFEEIPARIPDMMEWPVEPT